MISLRDLASANFDDRPIDATVDMLVIHYTGMQSAEAALARLVDPAARVSAHYLIDEDGAVTRLVSEDKRAWHAGVAYWRGSTAINARSIGIELVNPGHEFGYRPFPDMQMKALEALAHDIVTGHRIPARNVVGHSDVAPSRKSDPGELFDWRRLAAAGIGLWPATEPASGNVAPVSDEDMAPMLAAYGYDIADATAAIGAFQRHFCPHRHDGTADRETRSTLAALLATVRR